MGLFDKDSEACVDCGVDVLEGRSLGASACRCKRCRKTWADRADAAVAATAANTLARRKAEEEQDRTY